MEISPDMRAAVLAEQCAERGHDYSMQNVITGAGQTDDNQVIVVLGSGGDRAPHVVCARCQTTWLVVEVSGAGYDKAEADLIFRLADGDALRTRLMERRARRTSNDQAAAVPLLTADETATPDDSGTPEVPA